MASVTGDIEHINQHLTREWLYNRRLVVFRNTGNQRADIDLAVALMKDTLVNWPKEQLYLGVIDAAHETAVLTPYARQKLQEAARFAPEIRGYTAVVIDRSPAGQLLKLFTTMTISRSAPRIRRVFFTRQEAIQWLLSQEKSL